MAISACVLSESRQSLEVSHKSRSVDACRHHSVVDLPVHRRFPGRPIPALEQWDDLGLGAAQGSHQLNDKVKVWKQELAKAVASLRPAPAKPPSFELYEIVQEVGKPTTLRKVTVP